MTEWLKIMLEEIERRRRADREALREDEQRQLESHASTRAGESGAAAPAVDRRS